MSQTSTKEHINFYECLKEARDRLRGTVVMYGDEPYYVHAITDHMKDGIYRVYLEPVGQPKRTCPDYGAYNPDNPSLGAFLDQWLESHPNTGFLRKQMNSPKFNKFRPFDLGMCNAGTQTYYLERQPVRPSMTQGLTRGGLCEYLVTAAGRTNEPRRMSTQNIDLMSPSFLACVKADHPSAKECLSNLLDPGVDNEAAAFHRDFAFVRGPIDMLFLAYKTDVVGILPKNDFRFLRLGRKFKQCREVVEELNLFGEISI